MLKGNNMTLRALRQFGSSKRTRIASGVLGVVLTLAGTALLLQPNPKPSVPAKISHDTHNTIITPASLSVPTLEPIAGNSAVTQATISKRCSAQPANAARLASTDEIIAKLAKTEALCGTHVFDGAMRFFSPNPEEVSEWQATVLKEAARLNTKTVVVLETDAMNFDDIAGGRYDQQITDYFVQLSRHVTAAQAGTYVVCGEPFVGERPGATDKNFVECVRKFTAAAHSVMPELQVSTMVDEAELEDLSDVLPQLKATGINSFGLQAFANAQAINFSGNDPDISFFINTAKLRTAIAKAGVESIWFNTGVTAADKNVPVTYTEKQRIAVAHKLANNLNELGTLSFVNLFMENKLQQGEGRDFSVSSGNEEWLVEFLSELSKQTQVFGFDS